MIELFPASSVDNSILTSVLAGVLILWFFQETLGWNFTGLVVPGYLASIFTFDPTTGAVVVLEAYATLGVVTLVSDAVPRAWLWTPLFGRDRFLLFLTASIGVRVLLEGYGFGLLARELGLVPHEALHSMGLVVVPLLANALWRAGVGGTLRVAVPVALTWLLLAFVLLPYTNLSLSSFELTYENLALDFVGSPRAHIVLLVGATLGSYANLRWGWDFGGIIVPALLALCWWQPLRLAATLGEATIIVLLYAAIIRLPMVRTANLTGSRPLVLAFVLGYFTRFGIAALGGLWPGVAVRDFFGFGYLLSAILALRFIKHGELLRAAIPVVTTSAVGFVGASSLAWILAILLPVRLPAPDEAALQVAATTPHAAADAGWARGEPSVELTALLSATTRPSGSWLVDAGSVWLRQDGVELAVVAAVGPLAMEGAAVAIAEATNAGVLLLCHEEGPDCERAIDVLAARSPVLYVDEADTTVLRVVSGLPSTLDLASLTRLVGDLAVDRAGQRAELLLDPAARLHAAASALGADPAPVVDLTLLPEEPEPGVQATPWSDAGFRGTVLAPIGVALAGGASRADALRFAAGSAAARNVALEASETEIVLHAPGWRVVARTTGAPIVVRIPDAVRDVAVRDLARRYVETTGARVVLEETRRASLTTQDADWAAYVARGALEWLGADARAITFRQIADAKDPGTDVVLDVGRRILPEAPPPAVAEALRERLLAAGLTVAYNDGTAQRLSYIDVGPLRHAAWANAGEEAQVTAYLRGKPAELAIERIGPNPVADAAPEEIAP